VDRIRVQSKQQKFWVFVVDKQGASFMTDVYGRPLSLQEVNGTIKVRRRRTGKAHYNAAFLSLTMFAYILFFIFLPAKDQARPGGQGGLFTADAAVGQACHAQAARLRHVRFVLRRGRHRGLGGSSWVSCILRHFRRREASAYCPVAFSPALATLPSQLNMKPRAGPTPDVSDAYRDLEDENVEGADGEEEPEAASPTAPPKLLEGVESDSDDEGGSAKGAKKH